MVKQISQWALENKHVFNLNGKHFYKNYIKYFKVQGNSEKCTGAFKFGDT